MMTGAMMWSSCISYWWHWPRGGASVVRVAGSIGGPRPDVGHPRPAVSRRPALFTCVSCPSPVSVRSRTLGRRFLRLPCAPYRSLRLQSRFSRSSLTPPTHGIPQIWPGARHRSIARGLSVQQRRCERAGPDRVTGDRTTEKLINTFPSFTGGGRYYICFWHDLVHRGRLLLCCGGPLCVGRSRGFRRYVIVTYIRRTCT